MPARSSLANKCRWWRYLRQALRKSGFDASLDEIQQIICDQLAALAEVGLIEEVVTKRHKDDVPGYQLLASALIWTAGEGTQVFHDPIRIPRESNAGHKPNKFFVEFYRQTAAKFAGVDAAYLLAKYPPGEKIIVIKLGDVRVGYGPGPKA